MSARRVSAGPYTLELPANGVAILFEADKGGNEHRLPGSVSYLDALVHFGGEVIRLQAMIDAIRSVRQSLVIEEICDDCPPLGYETHKTRCAQCPRLDAICMAGISSNLPCRPDDTLNRCTICGFVATSISRPARAK